MKIIIVLGCRLGVNFLGVSVVTRPLPKSLVAELALMGPLPRMLVLVLDHEDLESEPLPTNPARILSMVKVGHSKVPIPSKQVSILFVAALKLAVVPYLRDRLFLLIQSPRYLTVLLLCLTLVIPELGKARLNRFIPQFTKV